MATGISKLVEFIFEGCAYIIILYLFVFINLESTSYSDTSQRRSQCKRPRAKRVVLRQRKEAPGPPDRIKERVDEGSSFHSEGPMKAKARDLAIAVLARGTRRSRRSSERSRRCEVAEIGRRTRQQRYLGARPE